MSLDNARKKIETWRQDYNPFRPYSSLDETAPAPFAGKFYESQPSRIF
jgi:putative transposase